MRNGNFVIVHHRKGVKMVLTVPMRNGNFVNFIIKYIFHMRVLTVPMRNGNEFQEKAPGLAPDTFLPYL